jgi:hypothetical protein
MAGLDFLISLNYIYTDNQQVDFFDRVEHDIRSHGQSQKLACQQTLIKFFVHSNPICASGANMARSCFLARAGTGDS